MTGARPTLEQVKDGVGNEEWLAALALLDLSRVLAVDAARYTTWSRTDGRYTYDDVATGTDDDTLDAERVGVFHPQPYLDWPTWVADVTDNGRGWSTTSTACSTWSPPYTVPDHCCGWWAPSTARLLGGRSLRSSTTGPAGGNQRLQAATPSLPQCRRLSRTWSLHFPVAAPEGALDERHAPARPQRNGPSEMAATCCPP